MICSLRSSDGPFHLGYRGGGTSIVRAPRFLLQSTSNSIGLAMDLSLNQGVRNNSPHSCLHVSQWIEKLRRVQSFEFNPEPWFRSLIHYIDANAEAHHTSRSDFRTEESASITGCFNGRIPDRTWSFSPGRNDFVWRRVEGSLPSGTSLPSSGKEIGFHL